MKWIGTRISYVDKSDKTTLIITPENPGIMKGLMGAWFFMWAVIGATIIWYWANFKMTQQEEIIILIFMSFWAYYFVRVGRSFFWMLYGREHIKIDKIALTHKNSLKTYGKAKEYFLENIQKIRVSVPKSNSFQAAWESSPWIKGGERVEFEYEGKTIRFGRKLDEKEAKLLFQLIVNRIETHLKQKKKD